MKLVVGLGNPGREYEATRHNIGFEVVSRFAEQASVELARQKFSSRVGEGVVQREKVLFQLPQTYMNRSGHAVLEAVQFYKIPSEAILVLHDDIDLELGRIKVDFGAGAAGHKGVISILAELGSQNFTRIRLGVGRPGTGKEVEGYVLSPFAPEEQGAVEKMIQEGMKKLEQWLVQKEREGKA